MTPVYSPSAAREALRRVLFGLLGAPRTGAVVFAIAELRHVLSFDGDAVNTPDAFKAFTRRVLGDVPAEMRDAVLAAR